MNHDHQFAWLNGREGESTSSAYGEVVVPLIAIRKSVGPSQSFASLPHGTKVEVIKQVKFPSEGRDYIQISASGVEGWIPEIFAARRWSTFAFLGKLQSAEPCQELQFQATYSGMELIIKQHSLALVTEGDPSQFDAISSAASNLAHRILAAQAPLSVVPLRLEFLNWVEVNSESSGPSRTIGFMPMEEKPGLLISNKNLDNAMSIVRHMADVPFLDLALSDFSQALFYSEHALIFLSRAIESVEQYFSRPAKKSKGMGKEKIMRRELGIGGKDIEYVTNRANASHRRHASSEGKRIELPRDELVKCYEITGLIIAKFATYLEENLSTNK